MIPRRMRIPGADLRRSLFRTRSKSVYFTLKTAANPTGRTRFAVIIGAAVDRQAVRRHTLKRCLAAALQEVNLGAQDAVLVVSPAAGRLTAPDLRAELRKLLSRI